jgi:hypothetical protein
VAREALVGGTAGTIGAPDGAPTAAGATGSSRADLVPDATTMQLPAWMTDGSLGLYQQQAAPAQTAQTSGASAFQGIAQPQSDLGFPSPDQAVGFNHSPYGANNNVSLPATDNTGTSVGKVQEETKDYTPTSFANPWDAMIGANAQVGGKGLFYSGDWSNNPEAVRQWLQAYADAGGDYRKQDKYYNTVSPGSEKIYWRGDPARPK